MTDDKKIRRVKTALTKTQDLTKKELKAIREMLDEKLEKQGKTRIDWLRENDLENMEAPLSNVLAGRRKSRPLVQKVCEYILN